MVTTSLFNKTPLVNGLRQACLNLTLAMQMKLPLTCVLDVPFNYVFALVWFFSLTLNWIPWPLPNWVTWPRYQFYHYVDLGLSDNLKYDYDFSIDFDFDDQMNLTDGDTLNWENPLRNTGVLGTAYLPLLLAGFNRPNFPFPTSESPLNFPPQGSESSEKFRKVRKWIGPGPLSLNQVEFGIRNEITYKLLSIYLLTLKLKCQDLRPFAVAWSQFLMLGFVSTALTERAKFQPIYINYARY